MNRLLNFIYKNSLFLLFLLLSAFSLFLTYRKNSLHRAYMFNGSRQLVGKVHEMRRSVADYFWLKEQNEMLQLENAKLRNALKENHFELFAVQDTVVDTLYLRQYIYTPAEVVNLTHSFRDNSLTINRGQKHGIKPGMGVISNEGPVGVVKEVGKHFSSVVPIIHSRFSTSVYLGKERYLGVLSWPGPDTRYAKVSDLPPHSRPHKGDSLFTTEKSGVFPPGLPIGTLETIDHDPEDLFVEASVRLFIDFRSLRHVWVVENTLLPEFNELNPADIQP